MSKVKIVAVDSISGDSYAGPPPPSGSKSKNMKMFPEEALEDEQDGIVGHRHSRTGDDISAEGDSLASSSVRRRQEAVQGNVNKKKEPPPVANKKIALNDGTGGERREKDEEEPGKGCTCVVM